MRDDLWCVSKNLMERTELQLPTKKFLLEMADLLWRRALDRIPAEALMEDDPGLMDALREPRFVPRGPAQEREFDLVLTIETMASCYDGQIALMSLPRWAQCGYPEIQLPETYAAALLATTVTEEVLGGWCRSRARRRGRGRSCSHGRQGAYRTGRLTADNGLDRLL
ncbi:hypothetical protein, partial [Polyangium sp. 15x6]|uniref:hypothetical protein n=1 Tax=Polyangium sp. 15x6 TaxID=3042687 RepID=UPI00249CE4F1